MMRRAVECIREGRIRDVRMEMKGAGVIRYSCRIKGQTGSVYQTWVEEEDGQLTTGFCTCPAYQRTEYACKHIIALSLEVWNEFNAAQKNHGGLDILAAIREQEKEMAQLRCKALEEERRRRDELFIDELLRGSEVLHAQELGEEKQDIRLLPVLTPKMGGVDMELKVGRGRMYVVRNLWDFTRRILKGEYVSYGKGLAFIHHRLAFDPQDMPIVHGVIFMTQNTVYRSSSKLLLCEASLDHMMRILVGREIELRDEDGGSRLAQVKEGRIPLALALKKTEDGAKLRVKSADTVMGAVGAYKFELKRVVCAFDADYMRAAGLLSIAEKYPDGLNLREEQIAPICAQVIAPSGATIVSGRDVVKKHIPMAMKARFYIDIAEGGGLTCRIEWDYGAVRLRPGEENPHICRDVFAEKRIEIRVESLFPEKVGTGEYVFVGDEEAMYALLTEQLHDLERFGEVMISDRLAAMNISVRRALSFGMKRQGTQLLVRADLGGLTQADLDAAYAAYRQKRKYVRLQSGTFLSGDALEQAAQVYQLADSVGMSAEELTQGGGVPLSRAMYLEQTLEEREDVSLDAPKALREWLSRLTEAQKTQAQQPETLQAELRPYQLTGLSWLCALSDAGFGGILADDMGLGKTVQALSLFLREKEAGRTVRALIVCPASLQFNWQNEAVRFAPSLPCQALMGTAATRARQIAGWQDGVLVTSYDQLKRDVEAYRGIELTHVFLDEAQYIKNAASQAAKAVKTLKAEHRFALTGTPIENRLSELWSIFDFLMPGYLYAYKKFKTRFEAPIVAEGDEQARHDLHMMAAPFILRRMKKDVLTELPDKIETVMTSEMTAGQSRVYHAYAERLMREAESEMDSAQGRMKILAGLTRLRQICCDPRLCLEGYTSGSGKLEQAIELVRDMAAQGHRMLIFSQFTSMLDLLEAALHAEGLETLMLTGTTGKEERMRLVEQFNSGNIPVFLISLKAGGTGLNLTGADVVIHYDPWWNTAAQNQATDRAYRIGQTKGVQVFSLIASGTIEERIVLLQQEKKELSDGVLLGEDSLFTVDASALREILKA